MTKNQKIKEAQRLYREVGLTFRQISKSLKLKLSDVIHYCTSSSYYEPEKTRKKQAV